ncbi:MAG TPA: DUF485 domain-containing protein [Candidatus Corynebacterium gallistercoris]|uniref:DUF485 domain-containing protein n=1 Tax=Candidatus Corynebacterium gallistercoris TaxID=2838530 RepID=A0A9D1UQG8_9CORY|nr:DUF485 domain-containing protein [Candidatus Corynebacterium gallistercoris]
MSQPAPTFQRHEPTPEEFIAVQRSPEFQELRSKQRGFTFPLTILFVVWFVVYVLIAMYFPSVMSHKLWGNINSGILLGFLQFVSTFAITWAYVKFANKELEPRASAIREEMESGAVAAKTNGTGQA